MADRKLSPVIQIDGRNYDITAKKVANKLTIKNGDTTVEFDGSEAKEITVTGGSGTSENAGKIQVNMDNNVKAYATISIKSSDPTPADGSVGDIWFKY